MPSPVGSAVYVRQLRHALAFASDLHRRCIVNKQTAVQAARKLGLDPQQVQGVVRLLGSIKYVPTFERLALVAQRDYGLDDEDIGEIFGRTPEWSADVRRRAKAIRRAEPIDSRYEWLEPDLQPGIPTPEEIAERAAALRQDAPPAPVGIKQFAWSHNATLVCVGS
jgi:hypothetical protein